MKEEQYYKTHVITGAEGVFVLIYIKRPFSKSRRQLFSMAGRITASPEMGFVSKASPAKNAKVDG